MSVSITTASFSDDKMWLALSDGRVLGVPLAYFPLLEQASAGQRAAFELSPYGIHWDALDEDLSLEGMLITQPLEKVRPRRVSKS